MARPGPKNDITDIAGLRVGQVEDKAVNTGVTVLVCDAPSIASVDVAGGGPGTRCACRADPPSAWRRRTGCRPSFARMAGVSP